MPRLVLLLLLFSRALRRRRRPDLTASPSTVAIVHRISNSDGCNEWEQYIKTPVNGLIHFVIHVSHTLERGFCENDDVAVRPDVAVVIVIRSQVQLLPMYLLTAIALSSSSLLLLTPSTSTAGRPAR